ncbi:hypothetical protein EV363DRAFT_1270984 [Boletus edulis]|nr:hypothetical protein EV363DRAFT_1270984 [Boletus edulis]
MREANFAFPAQNRACVCISSQLYDRRALDTTSPLPLFNSLHHLTYLTSTSPRIREIMTMDGGLERLVRILHDFCMCPPPPENPNVIYGLSPPNTRPPKLPPTLNPPTFDKHAAYRFSLAFQCVVNIGVRGSEPIRSRVVQAGTLDVVGCILEAWLANKGFAIGPSSSATGLPRESRGERLARRQALAEQRQRDGAAELTRALQRQIAAEEAIRREHINVGVNGNMDEDVPMVDVSADRTSTDVSIIVDVSSQPIPVPVTSHEWPSYDRHSASWSREIDTDTSAETSTNATPSSRTPTATVVANSRERSGTIIARPVWDEPPRTNLTVRSRPLRTRTRMPTSPDESTDNSRPETETEDDGDADVEMDQSQDADDTLHVTLPRAPRPPARSMTQRPRRTVGIIADAPDTAPLEMNADVHIIINHGQGGGVDGEGVGVVGVEDGIVSLEPNDDFAMGAPPGAPGAMDDTTPRNMLGMDAPVLDRRTRTAPDATPRATVVALPPSGPATAVPGGTMLGGLIGVTRDHTAAQPVPTALGRMPSNVHHHRDTDQGPFKDEDVLLSLQLLAYLSKYPHVRQAFYKQRVSFHPAAANLSANRTSQQPVIVAGPSTGRTQPAKESHGFFRAFASATARGKEKEKASAATSSGTTTLTTPPRMTNVFSLVERFTFRPSSSENDLPNPPPKLPPEIQYWAGVIMRNACRKDDSRGGIRQCANMLCGKWESFPREFAKCRRCRKAKYCGKECQSTAWSEGHRFWCSAKDGEEAEELGYDHIHGMDGGDGNAAARAERRAERERLARERAAAAGIPIPVNQVQLVPPNVPPPPAPTQPMRQRVTALPPNVPQPVPSPTSQAYAQLRNRRRAETVSGATTVVGLTPQGRPVYRHEVAWLADSRGRDPDEGAGGGTPGPAHPHAPLANMIWETAPQSGNDIVLG